MKPRILVAGIGNIFHRDDAFGVAVAQHLLNGNSLACSEVRDFGIRGIDLVFAFLDGYDLVVLVDAVSRGGEPGTLYLIEPDLDVLDSGEAPINGHSLDPWQVLRQAARMGAKFGRVVLVGCEPLSIEAADDDDGRIGLSKVVEAAVEPAARRIRSLVAEFLNSSVRVEECAV